MATAAPERQQETPDAPPAAPPGRPGDSDEGAETRGGFRRMLGVFGSGYPRSFAIGTAFSVAWSPCIGPILGVVLTLAATSGTAYQGALLLVFYSLGLGVWFLAFGGFFSFFAPRMRKLQPHMQKLMIGSGVLFIGLGALMILGRFSELNNYFASLGFFFGQTVTAEEGLAGGGALSGAMGPAIAFFGGIVSFLSPCVLPLVPAYLVNLAGESVLDSGNERADRRRILGHSVAFVVGFTLVFAAIGASVGLVGNLVIEQLDTLTRIGGGVLIIMGLQMSGLIHIPYLDRTFQVPQPN